MPQKTISWQTFRDAIGSRREARFFPSVSSLGAMVYLYLPRHPDSNEHGLVEIAAVASPTFFPRCPKEDMEVFDVIKGKKVWVRGYNSFFRGVAKTSDPVGRHEVFEKRYVKSLIPDAFDRYDSQKFKKEVRERNLTDHEKTQNKIKGVMRPMKGNGDPVGGKRETNTVYSFASA